MISGIANSISGLAVSQTRLNTTSHNVANANTDGFKKHRASSQESLAGGVQVSVEQVNKPGPISFKETEHGLAPVEQSNVELGEELVDLTANRRFFEGNLQAVNVQNETLGKFLDILG